MYYTLMNDKPILEILGNKKYYNVVAMILACKLAQESLKGLFGEQEAFNLIGKTLGYKRFAESHNLSRNPIPLTPCGHIYRDHFQLAGAFLAGKKTIGTITKKIPCEFGVYDEKWARQLLSERQFDVLDKYYDTILGKPVVPLAVPATAPVSSVKVSPPNTL